MTWNRNRLTEKLGIDYPIIQTGGAIVAYQSNFGGLGYFGALSLSPEEIKKEPTMFVKSDQKTFLHRQGHAHISTVCLTANPDQIMPARLLAGSLLITRFKRALAFTC